ncbi:MAG: hypothetical protein K0Q60_2843 [Microvirga sp.]|nr:hypothetical protein [Microvirga sp.]
MIACDARNSEGAGLGQRQERGGSVRGRTGGIDDRGPLLGFGGDERLERVRATPLRQDGADLLEPFPRGRIVEGLVAL